MWWRKENRQTSLLVRLKWTSCYIRNLHKLFPPSMVLFLCGILLSAPRREDKCCSTYWLRRREGGREEGKEKERELCAFSASPSLHLYALARCKVTLSSYMCRLKDYKTERKWMVLFFLLLYMELLSVFPGCSLCRLTNSRSEETERLFTCQPQSSGCVVSPAAVDDTLTTLAALELHSYAVTGEAGPRAWTKVLAGKWRSNQYQKASFASVRLCNV